MPDGEKVTLAERLAATAAERRADLDAQAEAARQKHAEEWERTVQAGAEAFRDARLEHLPTLLAEAAEQGKFEYRVWHEGLGGLNESTRHIHMRGLVMVRDWLREQGFRATLDEDKDDVPDYGLVENVTLTARWGPSPSGSSDRNVQSERGG